MIAKGWAHMKLITLVALREGDWMTGNGWERDLMACPFIYFQFQTCDYITYSKIDDTKECILYDSIYLKFWKRLN